ncbi:OmpA family protein [Neolewinella antarctica]|uniref:Outer membrane protein OmpA-like peptidoglycan-associated protein n=1 Tax=Neolewinella antarctica TaxID=442734 RepID=A0ABX0X835_9BACT|nr:OmpA family protein [Neolewinella antarctica]NJC25404.1 outer membrane protein OmpA-like peptidoglycan-associated protein [Neolewinella antarctica]
MFRFRLLFLCCVLIVSSHLGSQDRPAATVKFLAGSDALTNKNYKKAAKSFRRATELDAGFIPAHRLLGLAEELRGNLPEAAKQYEFVLSRDSMFSRLLYHQLGSVYYRMSRPKLAEEYYLIFQELQSFDPVLFGRNGDEEKVQERAVLKRLPADLRSVRITQDSAQFVNVSEVDNMGPPINTVRDDYFPFFANDLNSFYYTRQGEFRDEDLIEGVRAEAGMAWTTSRFGNFNTLQPEGMCTLVRDGERIYFTVCHEKATVGGCDLFTGWIIKGKVERVEALPDYVNAAGWESQPAISCDGQQLFFASIRPGGLGGSDIYVCSKNADGTWSEPKNLGDGVNSPQDEEGPFLSNDGQILYFASMGHEGFGDQDIYMSYRDRRDDRFGAAINLGPPINGPHRELGFHLGSDGRTGFFASDRPGGLGGLDIYEFQLDRKLTGRDVTYVSGYVTDSLTGEPITEQAVSVLNGPTYYTNYAGRFFICASADAPLPISVANDAYLPYYRNFAVPTWDNREPYRIDLKLTQEKTLVSPTHPETIAPSPVAIGAPEKLKNDQKLTVRFTIVNRSLTLRFKIDDASLPSSQVNSLNDFVALIIDKPVTSLDVIGYADDSGAEEYNLDLSRNRAQTVARFLETAGITATETRVEGMGEISGPGARSLYRKVEIKVTYRQALPADE